MRLLLSAIGLLYTFTAGLNSLADFGVLLYTTCTSCVFSHIRLPWSWTTPAMMFLICLIPNSAQAFPWGHPSELTHLPASKMRSSIRINCLRLSSVTQETFQSSHLSSHTLQVCHIQYVLQPREPAVQPNEVLPVLHSGIKVHLLHWVLQLWESVGLLLCMRWKRVLRPAALLFFVSPTFGPLLS